MIIEKNHSFSSEEQNLIAFALQFYMGKIEMIPVRVISLRRGSVNLKYCAIHIHVQLYSWFVLYTCMTFAFLLYFHMLLLWFMLLCEKKLLL